MSRRSAIEWIEMTWNPVSGCTKLSPGCVNCYAERMAKRLKAMGAARYRDGFALRMHEAALQEPASLEVTAKGVRKLDVGPVP